MANHYSYCIYVNIQAKSHVNISFTLIILEKKRKEKQEQLKEKHYVCTFFVDVRL